MGPCGHNYKTVTTHNLCICDNSYNIHSWVMRSCVPSNKTVKHVLLLSIWSSIQASSICVNPTLGACWWTCDLSKAFGKMHIWRKWKVGLLNYYKKCIVGVGGRVKGQTCCDKVSFLWCHYHQQTLKTTISLQRAAQHCHLRSLPSNNESWLSGV